MSPKKIFFVFFLIIAFQSYSQTIEKLSVTISLMEQSSDKLINTEGAYLKSLVNDLLDAKSRIQ